MTTMKLVLTLCLILSQAPTLRQSNHNWHPATYRGLNVGNSRRAEMLRVFGQPKWSRAAKTEDRQEVWNNYEGAGEFPGITIVAIDNRRGIIKRIDFYPEKLSKQQAVAHFGRGYIITKYDFEACRSDEESEPIYESPSGLLTVVEYRARGIAIFIGHEDLVTKISYVSGPIGRVKSRCE
jgi:hypothetical protein